jgi:hypothetical protein
MGARNISVVIGAHARVDPCARRAYIASTCPPWRR